MSNEIVSNILGKLTQDEDIEEWLYSEEVEVPFFDNQEFMFVFMKNDPSFVNESDSAIRNFIGLEKVDRLNISDLVYQNCFEFLEQIDYDELDKPLWEINDKNDIWNFVTPTKIYVSKRHRRDCDIYIHIACECAWEQEHGLQLVFRQGKKLTRISDQDGHLTLADAFDKPDEQDKLFSEF
jgi:hypothetical protein